MEPNAWLYRGVLGVVVPLFLTSLRWLYCADCAIAAFLTERCSDHATKPRHARTTSPMKPRVAPTAMNTVPSGYCDFCINGAPAVEGTLCTGALAPAKVGKSVGAAISELVIAGSFADFESGCVDFAFCVGLAALVVGAFALVGLAAVVNAWSPLLSVKAGRFPCAATSETPKNNDSSNTPVELVVVVV